MSPVRLLSVLARACAHGAHRHQQALLLLSPEYRTLCSALCVILYDCRDHIGKRSSFRSFVYVVSPSVVRPRELRQMEYHRGEELVLTVRTAANKRFYFSPSTEKELVALEKHLHDIRKWGALSTAWCVPRCERLGECTSRVKRSLI